MSSNSGLVRSTFERVYATLKRRLRTGVHRPGERLEPAHLSVDLHSSVTPVRDALHRLTGERLVDAPPHEGFRVPLPSETMIRYLYAWHRDLLLLALAGRQPDRSAVTSLADIALNELLERIVAGSGNPLHLEALRNVRERLGPFEQLEGLLLEGLDEEIRHIAAAVVSGNRPTLRRALIAYHRRRARLVPQLLALATGSGGNNPAATRI